ncbi:MAG: hypothetical protein HKM01_11090 [Gallionella sp.]|nr:hypothetical protein [Gallionella sp.]
MKRAKQKRVSIPRNPLVALVLFKKSGAHSKTEKALRREAHVAIRKKAHCVDE